MAAWISGKRLKFEFHNTCPRSGGGGVGVRLKELGFLHVDSLSLYGLSK